MLDHIGLQVSDYQKSKAFYSSTLATLGYSVGFEVEETFAGFSEGGRIDFWIGKKAVSSEALHVAFSAKSRAQVDAFYEAALAAGGKDNGKPGPRPHYHENYYGAFVLDPDGYNIEAVCHLPQ